MFEKSIIITAHPDDEVLWFSSILDKVGETVICFLESKSGPSCSGRKKSLSQHPVKNISCLEIDSAGVFSTADWINPVITRYGLNLSKQEVIKGYERNYHMLKERLQDKLKGYHNVFTHNPWGDYGHEEHVQVYRVVNELKDKLNFRLWFSNYCSNISFNLMLRHVSGFYSKYETLRTNRTLASAVMNLYKENGSWTWYDDWQWFTEESFMQDGILSSGGKDYGHIFPLNMIKFNPPGGARSKDGSWYSRLYKRVRPNGRKKK